MTTAEANKILARYAVTLSQAIAPGGRVICTTTSMHGGHVTQWYAGMTPEDVIAAYRKAHGF